MESSSLKYYSFFSTSHLCTELGVRDKTGLNSHGCSVVQIETKLKTLSGHWHDFFSGDSRTMYL